MHEPIIFDGGFLKGNGFRVACCWSFCLLTCVVELGEWKRGERVEAPKSGSGGLSLSSPSISNVCSGFGRLRFTPYYLTIVTLNSIFSKR